MAILPRPEDFTGLFNSAFVAQYWPLILGVIVSFVLAITGRTWATIVVMALAGAGQLWRMGLLG